MSWHSCDAAAHLHGHAELFQPLLFQVFGLEKELKAALALVMSEVESVGPLQQRKRKTLDSQGATMPNKKTEGFGERQTEREGAERDRMQGDRWRQRDAKWKRDASGRANTKAEGLEGRRNDRKRQNIEAEREGENECEVAVPYNC